MQEGSPDDFLQSPGVADVSVQAHSGYRWSKFPLDPDSGSVEAACDLGAVTQDARSDSQSANPGQR
jgi:hypothetical protein